ncbi:hypothetical protein [Leucobacter sp. W1038]|uniref:hypothetical protein n=1 Tax=Leucobacter sp. W1038 TaxID=3438281 RepID=UPI003D969BFB
MDQIANWVRFADTKATVLTAGLGVAVTILASNATQIFNAVQQNWISGLCIGGLCLIAFVAFLWALFWLVRAIIPQRRVDYGQPNRFSWPSLANTTNTSLRDHLSSSSASDDAWQQVIDLSKLANRKFAACTKAIYGFSTLLLSGFACVIGALIVTM